MRLAALLTLALAAPALAEVTDRVSLTLGALADGCDRIVLARVVSLEQERVQLEVLDVLKGRPTPIPSLARGDVSWRGEELALLFLDEAPDGTPAPPRTAWHKLSAPDPATRDHLLEVVRGRLPTIGGDPTRLRGALFAQLASPVARVREDAALELLGWRELAPEPADRVALRAALEREPARPELLELAARLPEPGLLAPALAAGRGARDARTRLLAAEALRAIDEAGALAALASDLRGDQRQAASAAARLVGALGGPAAERLLAAALSDPRPEVRRGALAGLGEAARRGLSDPAPLLSLARGPEREAARKAIAALARAADGASLRQLETSLQDPELRGLVARLRAEPTAAQELLGE